MSLSPTRATASPWHDSGHCLFLEDRVLRALYHSLGCAAFPNWQWPYMGLGPGLEDFKWLWLQSRVNLHSPWRDGFLCHGKEWTRAGRSETGAQYRIRGLLGWSWWSGQSIRHFWVSACCGGIGSKQGCTFFRVLVSYNPWINSISFQISLEFCLSGTRPQGCDTQCRA